MMNYRAPSGGFTTTWDIPTSSILMESSPDERMARSSSDSGNTSLVPSKLWRETTRDSWSGCSAVTSAKRRRPWQGGRWTPSVKGQTSPIAARRPSGRRAGIIPGVIPKYLRKLRSLGGSTAPAPPFPPSFLFFPFPPQDSSADLLSSAFSSSLAVGLAAVRNSATRSSTARGSTSGVLGGASFRRPPGPIPFRRERALPRFVRGPVEKPAFRLVARICVSVAILGSLRVEVRHRCGRSGRSLVR
ncbi:hypothetical protein OJF2_14250 [Aquisphaera giovannonii]|uniref:Uncharacterized protein n=1 Tax=Aquisphaera giovannonii TaxID=406548 RepID=A0A5B9VYW6_9BACT|nr:hypothetical protein OJF2_14250 [Aquisphaera giovannonii]